MAETNKTFTLRNIFRMALVIIVVPLVPMIVSGVWDWWEAWVYAFINILGFAASRALAARRHPDILAERAHSMEMQGVKSWDKTLAPMMALGSVAVLVVVGLDKLLGWTHPFDVNVKVVSVVVIVLGYVFGSWALIENRFFSGVVRIQTDRGHHVVKTGPYRFVRHPGYAGALWAYIATPFLLDSLWALIPTLLLIGVLALRTTLEDRALQAELPGYGEYAQRTRYRLFPGVW